MQWVYVISVLVMFVAILVLLTNLSSMKSASHVTAALLMIIGLTIGSIFMTLAGLKTNEENVKVTKKYEDIELIDYKDKKVTYITEDNEYVIEDVDKVYIDDDTYIITEGGYRYLYAPLEMVKGE